MSELSDLRAKVDRLNETAARTDANVSCREAIDHQVKRGDKHDERIASVERRQWWLSGAAAVIGALLGIGGGSGLKG